MSERLKTDARTAWAYRQYIQRDDSHEVGEETASALLAMLEPDEHVEFLGDARMPENHGGYEVIKLQRTARPAFLAVRTIGYWALIDQESGELLAPLVQGGSSISDNERATGPDVGWGTWANDPTGEQLAFKVFCRPGSGERDIIDHGAGGLIKRLPDSNLALPLPDLASFPERVERERVTSLVTEWRTAEDVACAHMRSIGFTDARLSGGGRDGGLDVTSGLGVAQVKMQALPVSAPVVQQLRGAAPLAPYHLFYSTSGFTAAAMAAANEIGVRLYKVDADGGVVAANPLALSLARRGPIERNGEGVEASPATATQAAADYAERVTVRVSAALEDMTWIGAASDKAQLRARRYGNQALQNLRAGSNLSSPQAIVAYYHHTELLAITWFRVMGLSYPDGAKRVPSRVEESFEDYYEV
ncbi:restriction endonuclease [Modestobacter sp. SSW1-42]|uniref:restriction endonuclease n=1 Tax=Modestobacter sp. SSW1-42 TaxID=596372 RepID=UPI003985D9FD